MDHDKGHHQRDEDGKQATNSEYDLVPEGFDGTIYSCPMHSEVRDTEKSNCPICGMFLTPDDDTDHSPEHGTCSGHGGDESAPAGKYDLIPAGYAGTVWTCPMHPEVRDIANNGCPICGMALEPETISLDLEEDTSELDDMSRRFWVSAAPIGRASCRERVVRLV